jgi:tyrosyl-tRNA synthetase
MLTAESYRSRLEQGLSFLEFNYMIMQAYDFLTLFKEEGCALQLGGQDQWGNIVAGIELVRRETGGSAYGVTMPLLLDPRTGEKFGKTAAGAVWLSSERTPVYEFYQFWRNIDDQEAGRLLSLFTWLPLEECRSLAVLPGNLINRAKEILAFEVTMACHGFDLASEAFRASLRAFGASDPEGSVPTSSRVTECQAPDSGTDVPTVTVPLEELKTLDLAGLFFRAGLAASKSEARRLIRQGGAYADETKLAPGAENEPVADASWLERGQVTLRAGKKRHKTVKVEQ